MALPNPSNPHCRSLVGLPRRKRTRKQNQNLGDNQVKFLQSDGYNVYMYLDEHMVDIEHLCCMPHACAKFKYALE